MCCERPGKGERESERGSLWSEEGWRAYVRDDHVLFDVEHVGGGDVPQLREVLSQLDLDEREELLHGAALPHLHRLPVTCAIPVAVHDFDHLT
jgi:hypothetical protein